MLPPDNPWRICANDGSPSVMRSGSILICASSRDAYKPAIAILRRPAFVVHLGVFTETLYLAASPLKRWAWRKYICEREPGVSPVWRRHGRRSPSSPPVPRAFASDARRSMTGPWR